MPGPAHSVDDAAAAAAFPLGALADGPGIARGLARIARRIDRRGRELVEGSADLSPGVVHATRIGTKRVRAYWQLHKATPNAALAKVAIRRLRGAARSLAPSRDDHVLQGLLAELASEATGSSATAFERARRGLPRASAAVAGGREIRQGVVGALDADAADWLGPAPVDDDEMLLSGVRRSLVKARELGRLALHQRRSEELHRWRRWVKYLRYQLEPLVTPRRPALTAYHAELRELGRILGRRNDLHNLHRALADGEAATVLEAIRRREDELAATLPPFEQTLFARPLERVLATMGSELGV